MYVYIYIYRCPYRVYSSSSETTSDWRRSTPIRILSTIDLPSSRVKNNYFAEMCSGSKEGSYLGLIDVCITQL